MTIFVIVWRLWGSKGVRDLAEPFVQEATAWASCRPHIKIEASLDFEVGLAMLASDSAKPALPPLGYQNTGSCAGQKHHHPWPQLPARLEQARIQRSGLFLMFYFKEIKDKNSSSQLKVRKIHTMEESVCILLWSLRFRDNENTAKLFRLTMRSSECWALSVCYFLSSAKPPSPHPAHKNSAMKSILLHATDHHVLHAFT